MSIQQFGTFLHDSRFKFVMLIYINVRKWDMIVLFFSFYLLLGKH